MSRRKLLKAEEIDEIFRRFQKQNPHPKTELEFTNNFTLLVAVVLSAQATDLGVNKATKSLFKIVKGPSDILNIGLDTLKEYIKTIGLYNSKAKNIMALSKILVEKYNGEIPVTREELEALPGVGRKTANVVLNVAFSLPTIPVDTHIFRVSNRIGLVNEKTPLGVEKAIEKRIHQKWKTHLHHWLILHGRYICKARKPECNLCMINEVCLYKEKNIS